MGKPIACIIFMKNKAECFVYLSSQTPQNISKFVLFNFTSFYFSLRVNLQFLLEGFFPNMQVQYRVHITELQHVEVCLWKQNKSFTSIEKKNVNEDFNFYLIYKFMLEVNIYFFCSFFFFFLSLPTPISKLVASELIQTDKIF